MNDNHIYEWARKSGINIHIPHESLPSSIDNEIVKVLKKFAEYSAGYERQLCAKVCDRQAQDKNESEVWTGCAKYLANKIRARGEA